MKRKGPKTRRRLTGPIHERIKALREKKGIHQDDLAAAVGVSKTAVSHWENGIARPDLSNLTAVASALGVTVAYLIRGEEKAA